MKTFSQRIQDAEFVNDIPHFYECEACGYKSNIRQEVIDHQLDDCEQIGYLEEAAKWVKKQKIINIGPARCDRCGASLKPEEKKTCEACWRAGSMSLIPDRDSLSKGGEKMLLIFYVVICASLAGYIEFIDLGWPLDVGSFLAWSIWTTVLMGVFSPILLFYDIFVTTRQCSPGTRQQS